MGITGLATAALIGCGSDNGTDTSTQQTAGPGTATGDPALGKLIPAPGLPFPYNFPEPAGKTPKAGGALVVQTSWDVSTMGLTKSGAGGTVAIPNNTSNKLLGYKVGNRPAIP